MNFCQECGKPLEPTAAFCTNCGTKTEQSQQASTTSKDQPHHQETSPTSEQIVSSPKQTIHHEQVAAQPKQPMGKGKKILLSIIALFAIALIGTHFYLSNHFDPLKKIEAMNDAFHKKDQKAFYEHFNVPKGTIATADSFFNVVQDMNWPSLRSELMYQIDNLQEKVPTDPIAYEGADFIRLEKKPILFGLYNDISFSLIPLNASIEVPFKEMTVTIADEIVTSKEDDEIIEIGQFIPGTYDWSFKMERHQMPLKNKGTVELYAEEGQQALFSPDWGFETVSIYSEVDDAILYVNGKSTKEKVSGYYELYPVILDDKTEIQLVTKNGKGKEVTSEKMTLDSTNLDISFKHIEQEKAAANKREEVESVFYNFRSDYEDAIYTLDFSYIRDYFKPNSKIQKDYRKFVEDHATIAGYDYDFRTNEVTDVKEQKDGKYELTSFETFYYSSADEGTIYYERTKKYVLSEENGMFYIESIDNLTTDKQKQ